MRISDWSSDVCSSDLDFRCRRAVDRYWRGRSRSPRASRLAASEGQARSSCRAAFDQAQAHARPRAMRAVRVVAAFLLGLGRLAAAFIEADGRFFQIGRAHVRTPVTTSHHVCRRLLEKKKNTK